MGNIITTVALTSAIISTAYAIWQKKSTQNKIFEARAEIINQLKPIREQNVFPHPCESDLKKMNKKTCVSIANQLDTNSYSSNDYGNLTRECAIMIIKELALNMNDEETLSEYFERK